jgi:hypothetical protein
MRGGLELVALNNSRLDVFVDMPVGKYLATAELIAFL